MQKLAKRLSVFMAAIMTLSMMLTFVTAAPAKAATVYPQVQYAQEPQLEYTVGDRVQFNLHTPNYGGRVQYRVVLWNDETKSYRDLWTNTPDRYYDKWMPYGNNIFTLGWVINEPGHYRITIYAKRAGVPNNQTYLQGKNCDSYMESDSFVVKAKVVADVAADSIKLDAKTAQMVVGQEYTLKANVGKAGVRVLFDIDAPASSMNKDMTGEAVSDASGVATYKYTRTYGDADFVSAYPAASPSVRDVAKIYWGVTPILTIESIDKDDAVSVTNGGIKQYKVKLRNPMTGEAMRYKEVKVMLKENIDTQELRSTAVVTNDFNGVRVTPYQRTNNIVNGGLNEISLSLVTNDNGEATFTLSGYNTKATPIVYIDSYDFFNTIPVFQLGYLDERSRQVGWDTTTNSWIWGLQIPGRVGLPDTSQVGPTFAGDYDCRLDATELQAEAKTVSFVLIGYTFESTMNGDKYVAVDPAYASGRKYTVTVKKPDGKPFAGGRLMVRLEQLFDNVSLSNHTDARILTLTSTGAIVSADKYRDVELILNADGKASFAVASPTLNDIATPRVWIDQDTPNYPANGGRNRLYQEGEPTKLLDTIYFVNQAINSGSFSATLPDYLKVAKDADGNVQNLAGEITTFKYVIKDQNGNVWIPNQELPLIGTKVYITYTLTNNGANPIVIMKPALVDVKVSLGFQGQVAFDENGKLPLQPGDSITISGIDDDATSVIQAFTRTKADDSSLNIIFHAVATRSSDTTFPWSQPSNTVNAELGNATLNTSWIAYDKYVNYPTTTVAVDGKVVATYKPMMTITPEPTESVPHPAPVEVYAPGAFAVIELSNEEGVFVKVPLVADTEANGTVKYEVGYNTAYPIYEVVYKDVFESQMTLGDLLFYRKTLNADHHYILINKDNSID